MGPRLSTRAMPHTVSAMELLGDNGYVEDSGQPRLHREPPPMGIWAGSGQVSVLRDALADLQSIAHRARTFAAGIWLASTLFRASG